jgi:CO dehydrogenase maturation factor
MRIAFVGKGGSGKTTVAAAFSRHLAASGCRVVAVDADAVLLGCLTASAWVRAPERGAPAPFAELEADNGAVLADVRAALDARERDWAAYHRTTVAMHRANATAWAGVDRIAQIDPDFVPA